MGVLRFGFLLTLGLDQLSRKTAAAGPSFDYLLWKQLPCVWGLVREPLLKMVCMCVSRRASGAPSLSVELW